MGKTPHCKLSSSGASHPRFTLCG